MATVQVLPARGTDLLPREVSDMIFEDVARTSVVQRLARRIPLPVQGKVIPVSTTKPTASWVGEGERKPATNAARGVKLMDPKKVACVVTFSKEYLRGDLTSLFTQIRPQIAEAFGDAFDAAAIHGTASPFVNYIAETTKTVDIPTATAAEGGIYKDIVDGLGLLTADRKRLNGFAADPMFEPLALSSVDANGRPILVEVGGNGITQRLLGRPVGFGEGVSGVAGEEATRLVGGDWTKIAYGVGTEITYEVSKDASIEMIPGDPDSVVHLFQDNLVALLAEAEYGLVIADVESFVLYNEVS